MAFQMYIGANADKFPPARYMPPPFISSDLDSPLPQVLESYIDKQNKVFQCTGDRNYVYSLCGSSFTYNNSLSGRQLDKTFFARRLNFNPSEIFVSYDCDGNTFSLEGGKQISVPYFHILRNLLFADWHVSNYQVEVHEDPNH